MWVLVHFQHDRNLNNSGVQTDPNLICKNVDVVSDQYSGFISLEFIYTTPNKAVLVLDVVQMNEKHTILEHNS